MAKFKFNRTKRCEICSSKLDEQGNCTWEECPKNLAKKQDEGQADEQSEPKEEVEI